MTVPFYITSGFHFLVGLVLIGLFFLAVRLLGPPKLPPLMKCSRCGRVVEPHESGMCDGCHNDEVFGFYI